MNTTLSSQHARLLALLGLLAVCGLGYWLFVPHTSTTTAPPRVTTTSRTTTPVVTPARPATRPTTHPAKPTTQPAKLVTHGLPVPVARALRKHRVVVVALYAPGSKIDQLARAESRAAAKASGAGFVPLDVFRQQNGTPILNKLGMVDTPAVLVISRPANIYAKLPGVSDRLIVEQAVADARG
jgi:hypothetical protein